MIKPTRIKRSISCVLILLSLQCFTQELTTVGEKPISDSILKSSIRAKNIIMFGVGSTLLNRDVITPDIENFIQIQYKRFITPNLNINGNLKKFDIKNYDFDSNGFLSGDLNLEWYVFPSHKLSPFGYLGAGILASNDYQDQNYKVQGGLGIDYLLLAKLAIVASIEADYIYDEQKGSQLLQVADQLYFNALIGLCFYIGNSKSNKLQKVKKNHTSIINSNPIEVN
ncbi:hypothetical protein [Psychroserpens mesophilus]|uniref:hypothetical protein n=1 Tax=Psychroserpens mesophilus TaxID=325473 RepID=UPI000590B276|nr:hypothetical protein [Psychroserpens mesophilus]